MSNSPMAKEKEKRSHFKLAQSRRRARVAELAASGKDLRECEQLLREEGFQHVDHSTLSRDLKRERDRLNQATQVTVAQHRDQLLKNLLALETAVRERGLKHRDYVEDLLGIFNQLAKLLGLNADQRVAVSLESDPKKMGLYQRFLWESRGIADADFEKLWEFCRQLASPLGVIEPDCLPPVPKQDLKRLSGGSDAVD